MCVEKETGLEKLYVTYFFNVICPCALHCSQAVPIEAQLSCSSVTVDLDVNVVLFSDPFASFINNVKTFIN